MGNEVSSSEPEEDQEEESTEKNSEIAVDVNNGPVTAQSSVVINAVPASNDNSKQTAQQENIITSLQKTIVISPVSNGIDASPPPQPEKSKFRLTISRPSPGRTIFQPNGPDNNVVNSEVSLGQPTVIQSQNNGPLTLETTMTKGNMAEVQLLPADVSQSQSSIVEIESAPPKPKEVSIFDRIFKPEKKVQFEEPAQLEVTKNQEVVITVNQNSELQSVPPNNNLQKPDKGSAAAVDGRSTEPASVPAGQESEATQTSPEPEVHPVMSFFKTLVNKPVPKSEEDVKREAEDKSKKDEVLAGADKVVLEAPTVSVSLNSQQSAPEAAAALDNPSNVPSQITASAEEGRSAKEAAPRPRLFWRKSFKGDPQPNKTQENGVDEPAVVSVSPAPEAVLTVDTNLPATNVQPLQEEMVKEPPPRPLAFWRKSFKADPPPSKTPENGVDAQAVVTVGPAPEAVLTLDTNLPDTSVPPPQEEVVKEPPSRPLPFWRKSFKVDPPPPKTQEIVAIEQPVASVSVNMEQSIPPQEAAIETAPAEADTPPADTGKPVKEASSRPVPFWRKSFKGEPQSQKAQENIAVELPVVSASVNVEQSAPQPVTAAQDIKPAEVTVTLPEREKPSKEVNSRPVPFWRKSFKGDPPPPPPANSQDNSPAEEAVTVQLTETSSTEAESQSAKPDSKAKGSGSTAEGKSPEGKKPEEGKSTKPKIMMFFKQLSVIGDPSNVPSEEVNGKSKDSPTLDISDGVELGKTEKTVVTAVVEPPPAPPLQKMKENAKEKKASSEKLTKHESRECLDVAASSQVQVPEPAPVLNGAESSKESQLKRTEKRQSLGSFFKAIGPKRLCDAEVQTDPVSILPAEKAK